MSIKTYKQATWEAMKEEMLRDPSVYAMAEDIIGNGGSMGHYIGLGEAVGDQSRVLDAPISETAIVASAVGAALAGMRPVIDMRFSNCLPIGKARIAREGKDVSIVVYGVMVSRALTAAEELAKEGIDAEVIDLRTVSPWDKETVLASVKKTGRVVVAHEAVKQCGFGAELSATIAEEAFSNLKAPIVRIGAPFVPIPMTPHLEDLCRTLPKDIVAAVKQAVGK